MSVCHIMVVIHEVYCGREGEHENQSGQYDQYCAEFSTGQGNECDRDQLADASYKQDGECTANTAQAQPSENNPHQARWDYETI